MKIKRVVVFHVGARDNYLAPNFFAHKGLLNLFITDYWVKPNSVLSKLFRKSTSRRYDPSISDRDVAFYGFSKLFLSIFKKKINSRNKFNSWLTHDSEFTIWSLNKIKKIVQPSENYVIWSYTNASLEVLKYFQHYTNVVTVYNQVDPGIEYYIIQKNLTLQYPKLESTALEPTEDFISRIKAEWKMASLIVVNSKYSKSCLVKHGVEDGKIIVVPLSFKSTLISFPQRNRKTGRLNIAFVGNINLIKGFALFAKAAKVLQERMNFFAVGRIYMDQDYISETMKFIEFRGHVNKQEMENIYENIDVLVFPTYCDGFGMVQLEAMSYGIPVLASEHCGDVVQDDQNGFIIQNTAEEIVKRLILLDEDREKLNEMSQSAARRCTEYSVHNYETTITQELASKGVEFQ